MSLHPMQIDAPPRRLPWMPLAGLAITSIAGVSALLLALVTASTNRWVQHSIRTQVAIVEVGERLAAFESGYRGYMVRGNRDMLTEAAGARRALAGRLEQLRRDSADNSTQVANYAALVPLIRARINNAAYIVSIRPDLSDARYRQLTRAGLGPHLMVEIRARLSAMFAEEERLFRLRQRRTQWLTAGLAVGLAGAVLLVVVVAYMTVTEARRRSGEIERAHLAMRAEMAARESVESQLRQMQKMESIGQLTGGIAHDFNNMLAIVIGSLDIARHIGARDPERVRKCLDTAHEGADRAAALVARLLAFARRQPLSPAAIDINRLVAGLSELLRRTLGERIVIETRLAGGLVCGFADAGQLENAILNLAVNARDAMDDQAGTLTITTANATLSAEELDGLDVEPGDYAMIGVADSGVGMSAEVIERAIEPFFTTKDVGKGTGLGLSQVFGFVKQSGGHVGIESEIDRGTTVRLYLPKAAAPEGALIVPSPKPACDGVSRETVLVVEDEPLVRALSAEALRTLGYPVLTAAGGEEALAILDKDMPIALLFTDMMMPRMSGETLATRARIARPGLRLLYTTGYQGHANGEQTPPGNAAVLPKPFTIAQLGARVREAIDGG